MPELTKQEKIDAAVAIVQENARAALDDDPNSDDHYLRHEYTEAYHVTSQLVKQGVLIEERPMSTSQVERDRIQKRLAGQAKRLLDEEARKPDARILRFSSVTDESPPRLNGYNRALYGQAVGYTTPELYERALEARESRQAREREQRDEMADLLARARAAGDFPVPTDVTTTSVTFGVDGLRKLLERWA